MTIRPGAAPARDAIPVFELVPLSHLSLDLPEPVGGWELALRGRGIEVRPDDLDRPCISRADARRLVVERREAAVMQTLRGDRLNEDAAGRLRRWLDRTRPAAVAAQQRLRLALHGAVVELLACGEHDGGVSEHLSLGGSRGHVHDRCRLSLSCDTQTVQADGGRPRGGGGH